MKKFSLIFVMFLTALSAMCQVSSDKPVIFISASDSARQIQDLGLPYDTLNAVAASHLQNNTVIFGIAQGKNNLFVNLTPAPSQYSEGMKISFRADSTNTGSATLKINNLSAKPLLTSDGQSLPAAFLNPGEVITVVYDGSAFRLSDKKRLGCPPGYVAVTNDFCIEINERTNVISDTAVYNCFDQGARLCTFAEWYYACQNTTSLGLTNMINNWEWIDDSANHANTMGQAGDTGCTLMRTVTIPSVLTFNYRCCYSR